MAKTHVTEEQVDAWKKEHGEVFEVQLGIKVFYLKKPSRSILSSYTAKLQKNVFDALDVILKNCFLGGDEVDKTDVGEMIGFNQVIDDLCEVKRAELKKK